MQKKAKKSFIYQRCSKVSPRRPKMFPKCLQNAPRCPQDASKMPNFGPSWSQHGSIWLNLAFQNLQKHRKTVVFWGGFGDSAEWHISPHLTWSQNWHQPPSWSQNGSEIHIHIHTHTYVDSSILNHSNALPVPTLKQVFLLLF